jgi:hypothetical protein
MVSDERGGWSWQAFILGPFYYISKGMIKKGVWLLVLVLFSLLTASPFVWIYCGARGKGDWYDYRLREKSRINLNEL